MKKQLLTLAVLLGSFITVSAQQSYGENFSIYNGFTLGEIAGQNSWQEITTAGNAFTGCTIIQDIPVSTVGTWVTSGPSALRVAVDPNSDPSADGAGLTFKCLSPVLQNPGPTGTATTSFMIYIDPDNDTETTGSRYSVRFTDTQNAIVSDVSFFTDGSIKVLDVVGTSEDYVDTGATWLARDWMQVTLTYNFTANTISYNKTGEIIHEGSTLTGTNLARYAFMHDNKPGSIAYFDDIFVFSNPPSGLGVNTLKTPKFSVFPNPAANIVTITNTDNRLVENVTITDLNGRKIKSIVFNNVAAPQINIADLSAGVYMMTTTLDNGMTGTNKIIKN